VFDLINSWVSVGGQGDLFVSDGYMAGRAGPIGQFNFIRHRALRPFVIGGVAGGENDGPMVGSGMELWARDRIGFRVSAQDYVARIAGSPTLLGGGTPYTRHQLSVQFGVSWR
jgi:hypothetical protein